VNTSAALRRFARISAAVAHEVNGGTVAASRPQEHSRVNNRWSRPIAEGIMSASLDSLAGY
jgi:hypothetical protein